MRALTPVLLLVALAVAWPQQAEAGRRAFTWTWETEILPAGDFELEQWLWAKVPTFDGSVPSAGWLWFAPVYGLTDRVEIAVPWEVVVGAAGTRMTNFTAEARVALQDPLDDERFVRTLVRVFYQFNFDRPMNVPGSQPPWAGANFVASFGPPGGSHGTVDVGFFADLGFGDQRLLVQTLGFGYTHEITDELRLGAEYFHEISLGSAVPDLRAFFAGPALAYARGRVWSTMGILIGLTESTPALMPRFMVAIVL